MDCQKPSPCVHPRKYYSCRGRTWPWLTACVICVLVVFVIACHCCSCSMSCRKYLSCSGWQNTVCVCVCVCKLVKFRVDTVAHMRAGALTHPHSDNMSKCFQLLVQYSGTASSKTCACLAIRRPTYGHFAVHMWWSQRRQLCAATHYQWGTVMHSLCCDPLIVRVIHVHDVVGVIACAVWS